ncbi:MAG: hypothetical protein OEZ01_13850 [Candidatus Heimdallarchaeota archaeon]|nr:hypothetical protein [Candidatus Heimdallarchaeota archaeon]MDH5647091.1 hypothetical protein [Candidatus Heimdallarchaeota archaeon]
MTELNDISWLKKWNIQKISKSLGTPFYLYNQDKIIENYNLLTEGLHSKINVFYAAKANPNPEILRCIKMLTPHIEVSSLGEFRLSRKAGYQAANIIVNGPGKSKNEIDIYLQEEIGYINAESIEEIKLISVLADKHNWDGKLGIRINPDFNIHDTVLTTGGIPSKFGIDLNHIDNIDELLRIKIKMLHVHVGSRSLDGDEISIFYMKILEVYLSLKTNLLPNLEILDLGGGFGIPIRDGELPLDVKKIISTLNNLVQYDEIDQLFIEPGRFIIGNAGICISKILYIKESKGETFAIIDAGTNTFARNSLVRDQHKIISLSELHNTNRDISVDHVVGPLCTSFDWHQLNKPIRCSSDDYMIIYSTGAYGLTAAQSLFMMRPIAPELLINGDDISVINNEFDPTIIYDNKLITDFPRTDLMDIKYY